MALSEDQKFLFALKARQFALGPRWTETTVGRMRLAWERWRWDSWAMDTPNQNAGFVEISESDLADSESIEVWYDPESCYAWKDEPLVWRLKYVPCH